MINLKLNSTEMKVLAETLSTSLSRLGDEIAHTDSVEYRDMLKQRKEVLSKIRDLLH